MPNDQEMYFIVRLPLNHLKGNVWARFNEYSSYVQMTQAWLSYIDIRVLQCTRWNLACKSLGDKSECLHFSDREIYSGVELTS